MHKNSFSNYSKKTHIGEFQFFQARNGSLSCKINSVNLHSSYNPEQEGVRFAENFSCDFNPSLIIALEPCLSYFIEPFRKRFPDTEIIAIRFTDIFTEKDFLFNDSIYSSQLAENPDILLRKFGEEKLFASLIVTWQPAEKVFEKEIQETFSILKTEILKSRDILGTRSFFAKKWFLNCYKFCKNIKKLQNQEKTFYIEKENKNLPVNIPVVICASGPSLKNVIPLLKKIDEKNKKRPYFLIAVSSAVMPLLENDIIPDLAMTTDGGFYAGKHIQLSGFEEKLDKIVWAIASEAFFPQSFFKSKKILPITYNDNPEKELTALFEINSMTGQRNGTVSGTALEFAKTITSGPVFLSGLDLHFSKDFQHTQPNNLEIENSLRDNRLKTKETRINRSRFGNSASIDIYRQWFQNLSKEETSGIYRVSKDFNFQNHLGNIPDKNADNILKASEEYKTSQKRNGLILINYPKGVLKNTQKQSDYPLLNKNLQKSIQEKSKNDILFCKLKNIIHYNLDKLFSLEWVLFNRELNMDKKAKLKSDLAKKEENLVQRIKTLEE